jgi:hypothetical protein
MAVLDVFFQKSPDERAAERKLRDLEDGILQLQPGEAHESPIHAAICAKRWQLFNERSKLTDARAERRDRRVMLALVVVVALQLAAKIPEIWTAIEWVFKNI